MALDDVEFGARPERSTLLPVLLNDYDANGDVLVIDSIVADLPAVGDRSTASPTTSSCS